MTTLADLRKGSFNDTCISLAALVLLSYTEFKLKGSSSSNKQIYIYISNILFAIISLMWL